jgi:hypothetical protein
VKFTFAPIPFSLISPKPQWHLLSLAHDTRDVNTFGADIPQASGAGLESAAKQWDNGYAGGPLALTLFVT